MGFVLILGGTLFEPKQLQNHSSEGNAPDLVFDMHMYGVSEMRKHEVAI